jgi:ribosomal protein L18E
MPKATEIKGRKFRLPWKGPYKVQRNFNNNMDELSTLSNDDMEKINVNKLKEYQHNNKLVVVMTNVVAI